MVFRCPLILSRTGGTLIEVDCLRKRFRFEGWYAFLVTTYLVEEPLQNEKPKSGTIPLSQPKSCASQDVRLDLWRRLDSLEPTLFV